MILSILQGLVPISPVKPCCLFFTLEAIALENSESVQLLIILLRIPMLIGFQNEDDAQLKLSYLFQ